MRERRHQSGNSNMPRPASARVDGAASGTHSSLLGRCNGATTARRPEPEPQRVTSTETVSTKRRIHSARVDCSRGSVAMPTPTPGLARTSLDRVPSSMLPQLHQPPIGNAQVQWAVKAPTSEITDPSAKPGVPPAETSTIPSYLQPVLKDFSALLRDRYEGKRSLRLAFLNWDRDKDGQLSLQEIRAMVQTLGLTKKLGHHNVEAILAHVATTPSQSLRYNDFCGYVYGRDKVTPLEEPAKKSLVVGTQSMERREEPDQEIVLSSDRALYPDVDHVVNILRKKYETRQQLRQIFRHWDTDKDGSVTLQELDANLRRQGVKLPRNQLQELFDKHDANQDGCLTYQEFAALIYGPVKSDHHNSVLQNRLKDVAKNEQPQDAYRILKGATLQNATGRINEEAICAAIQNNLHVFAPRLHDAYAAFDDDHNGKLSYPEFRQGLDLLGLQFTEREFFHIASMVDADASGEISYREFQNVFTRSLDRGGRPSEVILNEPNSSDPEILLKQRAKLSKGRFDCSHLTRRAAVATRYGRTPYSNTKDLLSPTGQDHASQRFRTEASLYGSVQTPRSHQQKGTSTNPSLTLGQEEKQRKDANYAKRLDRIRVDHDEYMKHTVPLHDAYETTQQRRNETLHRHQQRYQSSMEDHRPPVAQRTRQPTIPPYITQ